MSWPAEFSVFLLDKFESDMLYSILFLPLHLDILTDYFYRCAACCQQTKALTPECTFPKFRPNLWIFFFQEPAVCTLISVDKFTQFGFWLCPEHYMNMINIMILFFQCNPIRWSNMLPDFLCSFRDRIIDCFSSIFHYHDQMVIHQIY